MQRVIFILFLTQFSLFSFGQIIADHSIINLYVEIPQRYIDSVKTRWVVTAGASHAEAYRMGCWSLGQQDSRFPVHAQYEGVPEGFSNAYLRINKATWGNYSNPSGWQYINGTIDWWSNATATSRVKAGLQYCNDNGPELYAILFGWSFDAVWDNPPGGSYDPVYHTRWAGGSRGGPQGTLRWGLDSNDSAITGTSVCMDTYIDVQHEYMNYCEQNNIPTKIIWSTGAVDNEQDWAIGESGYQQFLKWEHIRNHVRSLNDAYFIDYADILSYNTAGEQATTSWTDNNGTLHIFPIIHPENMEGGNIGHIGYNGALKLGKAMWWLLARMAGWEGSTSGIDITPPTVPSGLNITSVSINSVNLAWSASTDNTAVTGYRVYRSGSLLTTTTNLTYIDNTVVPCTNYSYTVSAFDAANNVSSQSTAAALSASIPAPEATLTQPTCSVFTGTIQITNPIGAGFEYSINSGATWGSGTNFALLPASAAYTISARNTSTSPGCISSSNFVINAIPASPTPPTVSSSGPVNVCPAVTINLTTLVTSATPSGGSILYKAANNPLSLNVSTPPAVGAGTYYIFYQNQEGCYSTGTSVSVTINSCPDPDVTTTLIVNPNIIHGTSGFDLAVKVTELNMVNTNGIMTVHIPKDTRWLIEGGYNPSLTAIGGTSLNNSEWAYSSDDINHIFTSSTAIPQGGFSRFGFRVTFNPDLSRGVYTITSQLVSGAGGEVRVSNNSDSESIDYFQE